MENQSNNCPICGTSLTPLGSGNVCPNCGYAHIDSPVADQFAKKSNNKLTAIIVIVVLVVWIIPEIIIWLLK